MAGGADRSGDFAWALRVALVTLVCAVAVLLTIGAGAGFAAGRFAGAETCAAGLPGGEERPVAP